MRPTRPLDRRVKHQIVAAGALSIVAWVVLQAVSPRPTVPWSADMLEAARRMVRAIETVASHCEAAGIQVDASVDPNGTCLIGPEYSPLFTTLGQLEAKRTTTNPDMAALVVHLLSRAGVSAGDTIAVGASASFPAALIATQAAAEAMRVHPVIILSVGASAYGATRPDYNLLDIHGLLVSERVLATAPAAVSLGGERDVGAEFDDDLRDRIARQSETRGLPLLNDPDLRSNVARRMSIFVGPAGDRRVASFVNIGGGDANIGTSPTVLDVRPGLNTDLDLPPEPQRGVLYEMAARDVPVIHLLHVRGLVLRYGLPWDPVPLPVPGVTRIHDDEHTRSLPFWLVTISYFASLTAVILLFRSRSQ